MAVFKDTEFITEEETVGQEGHRDYRKQLPCQGKYKISGRKEIESIAGHECREGSTRGTITEIDFKGYVYFFLFFSIANLFLGL